MLPGFTQNDVFRIVAGFEHKDVTKLPTQAQVPLRFSVVPSFCAVRSVPVEAPGESPVSPSMTATRPMVTVLLLPEAPPGATRGADIDMPTRARSPRRSAPRWLGRLCSGPGALRRGFSEQQQRNRKALVV